MTRHTGKETRRQKSVRGKHRYCRPVLELLEDRTLLSVSIAQLQTAFSTAGNLASSLISDLDGFSTVPIAGPALSDGLKAISDIARLSASINTDIATVVNALPNQQPITVGNKYYVPIELRESSIPGQHFTLPLGKVLNINGTVNLYGDIDMLLGFKQNGSSLTLDASTSDNINLRTFASQHPGAFDTSYTPSGGNAINLPALPANQLFAIRFVASLAPGFSSKFNLDNFLFAQAVDHGSSFGGTLGFNFDLANGLTKPTIGGTLHIGLTLGLSFFPPDKGPANFNPQFSTNMSLDWTFGNTGSSFMGAGSITGSFDSFTLNLGSLFGASSLLSDAVSQLKKYTEPIQPLIDALNKPIPILNEFGVNETFLDFATAINGVPNTLLQDINFINTFQASASGTYTVPGSYTFGDPRKSGLPSGLNSVGNVPSSIESAVKSILQSSDNANQIDDSAEGGSADFTADFPILENPASNIVSLLMGQNVPIFSFNATADLAINVKIPFGIAGLFDIGFHGGLEFKGQLSGGYDSTGLQELVADPSKGVGALADGFFFNRKESYLSLSGSLDLFSDLAIVHLDGGIFGSVTVSLMQTQAGGDKVYLTSLGGADPAQIFKITGSLDARAVLSVGIDPPDPLPSVTFFSWTLADVSLLPSDFDVDPTANPKPQKIPDEIVLLPLTIGTDTINVHPYVSNFTQSGGLRQTIGVEVDANGNEKQYPMFNFFRDFPNEPGEGWYTASGVNFDNGVVGMSTGADDFSGTHNIIVNLAPINGNGGPTQFGSSYPALQGDFQSYADIIEHLPVLLIGGPNNDELEYSGLGSAVIFGGAGDDRLVGTPASVLVGGPGKNDLEGAGVEVADRVDQVGADHTVSFPANFPSPMNMAIGLEEHYEQSGAFTGVVNIPPPTDDPTKHSTLAGGGTHPTLFAGPHGDTLIAYTSLDEEGDAFIDATLVGGAGDDTFEVEGAGRFTITGGAGTNTLIVEDAALGDSFGQTAGADHMQVGVVFGTLVATTNNNQTGAGIQTVTATSIKKLSLKPAEFDTGIEIGNLSATGIDSVNVTVPDDADRPPISVTLDGSDETDDYVLGSVVQPKSQFESASIVSAAIAHTLQGTLNIFGIVIPIITYTQTVTLTGLLANDTLNLDGGQQGADFDLKLYHGMPFGIQVTGVAGRSNSLEVDATNLPKASRGSLAVDNFQTTYSVPYPLSSLGIQILPADHFLVDYANISAFEYDLDSATLGNDVSDNQNGGDLVGLPASVILQAGPVGADRFVVTDPIGLTINGGSGKASTLTLDEDRAALGDNYKIESQKVTETQQLNLVARRTGTVSFSNIGNTTVNAAVGSANATVGDVESLPGATTINATAKNVDVQVSPTSKNMTTLIGNLTVNGFSNNTTLEFFDLNRPASGLTFFYQFFANALLHYVTVPGLTTPIPIAIQFNNLAKLTLYAGNAGPDVVNVTSPAVPVLVIVDNHHSNQYTDVVNILGLAGQIQVDTHAQITVQGPLQFTTPELEAIAGKSSNDFVVGSRVSIIDNNNGVNVLPIKIAGAFTNFPTGKIVPMNGLRYDVSYNVDDGLGDGWPNDAVLNYDNSPPTITSLTVPSIGHESQAVQLKVTLADSDFTDRHTVDISWGDGTPDTMHNLPNNVANLAEATQTGGAHQYASPGTYTITVTITDPNGGTVTKTATIAIYDLPLVMEPFVPTLVENTPFNGVVARFMDTGTPLDASQYAATIIWGDGTSSSGAVQALGNGEYQVSGSHAGNFKVGQSLAFSVKVSDPGGSTVIGPYAWQDGPAATIVPGQNALAVPAPGGKIDLVGGTDQNGNALAAFEQYDPVANSWTRLADMPAPLAGMAATADSSGNVYVFGGDGASTSNQAWEYQVQTKRWVALAKLPMAASYAAAVIAPNGNIYVLGGQQRVSAQLPNFLNSVQIFNPRTGSWTVAPSSMPTARSHFAAVVGADGLIYAIGGYGGNRIAAGSLTTVEVLDPRMGAWTVGQSLTTARQDFGAAVGPQGLIYAVGGNTNGTPLTSVEVFDARIQAWAAAPRLVPSGLTGVAAIGISNGRLLAIGGSNGSAVTSSVSVLQLIPVTVQDAPLSAQGIEYDGIAATPFTAPIGYFFDAGTDGTVTPYTATINWGDGTSSTGTVQLVSGDLFAVVGSHSYPTSDQSGFYHVLIDVRDSGGSRTLIPSIAFMDAPKPTASPTGATLVEGTTSSRVQLASFNDPHPHTVAGDFTATVTWDDGETDNGVIQTTATGYAVFAPKNNAYPEAGTHSASVTIGYRADGPDQLVGLTTTVNAPVTVNDAPLTDTSVRQTIAVTAALSVGQQVVATFSDANPLASAADFSAQVDWGDHTAATSATVQLVSRSNNSAVFEVLAAHTYASAGSYSLTVTIHDGGGQNVTSAGFTTFNVSAGVEIDIASDPTWQVYTDAGLTNLRGNAQDILLNNVFPTYPRPADAFNYNLNASSWTATTAANDPTGAAWIWISGFSLNDPALGVGYYFSKTINVTTPVAGTISLAVDDKATLFINGVQIGSVGSTTDSRASTMAQNTFTGFNVTLLPGLNTITVFAQDGAFGGPTYASNPAGVVFGGILRAVTMPTVTPVAVSGTEGAAINNAVVAHFTDAHASAVAADFTATATWDDGESDPGTVQADPNGGFLVLASKTNAYAEAGAHTAAVVVNYNPAGPNALTGASGSATSSVTVADAPLTDSTVPQTLSNNYRINEDTGPLQVATFLDANPLATAADFSASTIDWDDGTPPDSGPAVSIEVISRSAAGTVFQVVASHTFDFPDTYTVTVTIIDIGGKTLVISDIDVEIIVIH